MVVSMGMVMMIMMMILEMDMRGKSSACKVKQFCIDV